MAPAIKKRKLTPAPPTSGPNAVGVAKVDSNDRAAKSFYKSASSWDLEQDYETRPRKGSKKEKESQRLPVKTADGQLVEVAPEEESGDESDLAWLSQDEQEEEWEPIKEKKQEKPMREQLMEAKEELAKCAMALNEDPEENAGAFQTLAAITDSKNTTIKKLGLATQLAVYKDIIPGYRIRPLNEEDMETKVSKDRKSVV